MGVPPGADLKAHSVERLLALLQEMKVPLYVILVGRSSRRKGWRRATASSLPG